MNDDPSTQLTPTPSQTQPDPQVDDIVALGSQIQDDFAANDANPPTDSLAMETPVSDTPDAPAVEEKSPLDLLEELLQKESGAITPEILTEPPVDAGPTEEEIALAQHHEAERLAQIEQQRVAMQAEVSSEEQQKRDAIRQEQLGQHQQADPNKIVQIERKIDY